MNTYVYGIDVGGTNIKLGLFKTPDIELIQFVEFPTPKIILGNELRDIIIEKINKINEKNSLNFKQIKGIGIAIPCPVVDGYVGICSNLGCSNINIQKQFKEVLEEHVEVIVANDASMAAYGENRHLNKPYKNAVFYTLGTGVGGGIIVDGKIVEGKNGAAAELGHMIVFDGYEGEKCGCGHNGCLEQIAGTKGIFRLMKQFSMYENTVVDLDNLTVKSIFDAAKLGDLPALRTVDRVAEAIGKNAANLAMVLDPEVFIIGGGIASAGKFLLDKIMNSYQKFAKFNTFKTPFVLAKLKNNAGSYGAAYLIKDSIK